MKICIMGAGKMGMFMADTLCMDHDVAVYARRPEKLRYCLNTRRFTSMEEIREFDPDLLINAVTIKNTLSAFEEVLPNLRPSCMLSDIASVKTGLPEFYAKCGHPFVSTHPMFGPTFANLNDLSQNYTVIIKESDPFPVHVAVKVLVHLYKALFQPVAKPCAWVHLKAVKADMPQRVRR